MRDEIFQHLGYSPADCARVLQRVSENPESHVPVQRIRDDLRHSGLELPGDTFERTLLEYAAVETVARIDELPVYAPVKSLLREEFHFYTNRAERGISLEAGSYLFTTACKVISLRRFPSGPLDWELAGFPRSWLAKVRKRDLLRVLAFLLMKVGGFAPMFFTHVARRPKNRSLVIEREVLHSYYRIARSLELQPGIKGILTSSWFHDPAAVQRYPHLSWLNRPYLEAGGLITTAGPAPIDSGFTEHNLERQKQFERGEVHFEMGIAIWPRGNAIEWLHNHPDLAD